MSSQELGQAEKRAEFDRLMTAATVYRRRDDYAQATQTIKQALAIFPDNIDAREFAADMIYAHGDVKKAREHYRAILESEPGRGSVEGKFAKCVLELAEAQRQIGLVKEMVANPSKSRSIEPRSPGLAALLSIAPGFGHIYSGHYKAGVGFFGGWVLCWLLFFWTLNPSVGVQVTQKLSAASVVFGCLAAMLHICAIITAAQKAEETRASKTGRDSSEPE